MAAPSRIGNLTFSYHKETNESLKRLRKPKSLAASSRIFDGGSNKFSRSSVAADEYSHGGKNISHVGESLSSEETFNMTHEKSYISPGRNYRTTEKTYGENNTPSGNYKTAEKAYGENTTPGENSTETYSKTLENSEAHTSAYDVYLDKLLEGSKETKFYPTYEHEMNQTEESLQTSNKSEFEKYHNNENENMMMDSGAFSSSHMDIIYPLKDDTIDAIPFSQNTLIDESGEDTASFENISTKGILRTPPRSSLASPTSSFLGKTNKTSVGRSVSFSIPERKSFDADDDGKNENFQYERSTTSVPAVATVTRSNSKRLIDDDNNLKSLFDLARDESKDNLRARQPKIFSNQENETDDNLKPNTEEYEKSLHQQVADGDSKRRLPKTVRRLTFNKGDDKNRVVQSRYSDIDRTDSIRISQYDVADSSISNHRGDDRNSEDNLTAHDSSSISYRFSSTDTKYRDIENKPYEIKNMMKHDSSSIDYRSPSTDTNTKDKALENRAYKIEKTLARDSSPIDGRSSRSKDYEPEDHSQHITLTKSDSLTAKDYGSLIMGYDSATMKSADSQKTSNNSLQAHHQQHRQLPKNPSWKLKSNIIKSRNKSSFVSSAKDKSLIRKSGSFSDKSSEKETTEENKHALKGIGDILLSSDSPNETPLLTTKENERNEEDDIQRKRNTIGRSRSFVKSSVFMWGGDGEDATGGMNSEAPPTAERDNDVSRANYSNTARKNIDTNRQKTAHSNELVIHSHEYKHPEYKGVDVGIAMRNHAKNTSMAMNNRMGLSGESVVILDEHESSSFSFSGHQRLTQNFHSLKITGDSDIGKEKEKIIKAEEKRRRGKDLYNKGSPASSTTNTTSVSADSHLITNSTDIEWRSVEGDRYKTRQSKRRELPSSGNLSGEGQTSFDNKEISNSHSVRPLQNNYNSNKKRSIARKKTKSKRSTMEYGEFDNATMIKDNDSERASTDDGYETARTYGSDLTTSTTSSSDFNNINNPGHQNFFNKQFSESQQPESNKSFMDRQIPNKITNQAYNHVSNMETQPYIHQQENTENQPYNQHMTMDNSPYNHSLITYKRPTTSNRKVQSLSNLHEILNLESADERKQQEEETRLEQRKKEEEEELEQGRKQIHNKLDSMLKARVKSMNASDRAFAKRQMKFPDPLLVNEPPLIIDKEPSLQIMESVEQMSHQQSSSMMTPSTDHQIYRSQKQHGGDFVDTAYGNNNNSGYETGNHHDAMYQPQQRRIDASFNDHNKTHNRGQQQQHPLTTTPTADLSNKLFHLRDKESNELNKKQSMLHELKQAMFRRSRPGSPSSGQRDNAPEEPNQESYGSNDEHQHKTITTTSSYLQNSTHESEERMKSPGAGFSDPNFGYNSNGETDLYNSFPLPFPSTKSRPDTDVADSVEYTTEDGKVTLDETPINKNKVIMMLNSHIKEKTVSGRSDLQFRRPKITSQSFALTSKDIDDDDEKQFELGKQSEYNQPTPPPEILVTEFKSPEMQQNNFLQHKENAFHRPDEVSSGYVSRMESFSSTRVEAPQSRAVSRNQSFMSEYDASKEIDQSETQQTSQHFQTEESVNRRPNIESTNYRPENREINDHIDSSMHHNNNSSSSGYVSRMESFSSTRVEAPQSRAVSRNQSFISEYGTSKEVITEGDITNESFSQLSGYGRSRTTTIVDEQSSGAGISRNESFSQLSGYGRSRSNTVAESDSAAISRNESFSSVQGVDGQPLGFGRSRSSTIVTEDKNEPTISHNESFTSEFGGGGNRSRSSTIVSEQQHIVRNQSFSASETRGRSRSILDSAMRYEKNKTTISGNLSNDSPSNDAVTQNYIRAQQLTYKPSNRDITTQNDEDDRDVYRGEKERAPISHTRLVASESRGLNLSQTEYYHPSENDEKLIKPSEYKVHRFNDRNRAQKIIGADSVEQVPPANRIVLVGEDNKPQQQQQHVIGRRSPINASTENANAHLSLNDLKRKRQQERLQRSRRLSSSEPSLLGKVNSQNDDLVAKTTVAKQPQQRMGVTPRETRGSHTLSANYNSTLARRKKKIEKSSNEIYTNTNVGRINIPDSFQHEINNNNNVEAYPSEEITEHRINGNEDIHNDRKHKQQQQQQTSNSSTPRASTPKKSRRRFSLTNIVSGSSTPRSDITDMTSVSASRPSSASLGRRIKNMFSPRSKRKQKHNNNNNNIDDDATMDTVDDDIMRRLNMNVNPAHQNHNGGISSGGYFTYSSSTKPSLHGSLGDLTNGYSSLRSESGLSMMVADDEDFGIDDSFLSHQEWLNSQQETTSQVTNKVSKRPSIKQAMMPTTTSSKMSKNKNKNSNSNRDSWKVKKQSIGKVTVPEVFSSAQNSPDSPGLDNENYSASPYNTKQSSSRKNNKKGGFYGGRNDIVFTSFDVAK